MGIREWINKNQKTAAWITAALTALAIGLVVYQVLASRQRYPSDLPDAYFTVDDGKTYFVASMANYPPFAYQGGTAVRAHVFSCDGKSFVGYLERFTADTIKQIESSHMVTAEMRRFGREIKRPGDAVWTKTGDMEAEARVVKVTRPPGTSGEIVSVTP